MNLCDYKDSLGKPSEGLHSYRLFDIAIIDVIFMVCGAYAIASYTGESFLLCLLAIFVIGIVMHRVFCVRTTIDKLLF